MGRGYSGVVETDSLACRTEVFEPFGNWQLERPANKQMNNVSLNLGIKNPLELQQKSLCVAEAFDKVERN